MIYCDGSRSRGLKWLADKQLNLARELDLPAKSLSYNGFFIKVHQQDGIEGGFIKSPMGAVVLCSSWSGIKIASCDFWAGSCTSYADLFILHNSGYIYNETIQNESEEDLVALGYRTFKFRPEPFGIVYDNPSGSDEIIQHYSCQPSVNPYKGAEAFYVTVTDRLFVDLNDNDAPDLAFGLSDTTLTAYNSNNSNLAGRRTFFVVNSTEDTWRTCINLPSNRGQISFIGVYLDRIDESNFISYKHSYEQVDEITGLTSLNIDLVYLYQIIPNDQGMPTALRSLSLSVNNSVLRPLGSFAFIASDDDLVFIQVLYSDTEYYIPVDGGTAVKDWFNSNPAEEKWRMFISVSKGDSTTLIDSSQFVALLESLMTRTISWQTRSRMFVYLMAWPNQPTGILNRAWEPHDSKMFFGHDDKVYTWTRAVGKVCIDELGLHSASFIVPDEVTDTEGVRPDISYAGNDVYFCACNKVKEYIEAIYVGSPFASWIKLPDPLDTLVQVRPVNVTLTTAMLIGIVKETLEDTTEVYRFASLFWSVEDGGDWQSSAVLPFEVTTEDNFAMSLYGNSPLVDDLINYPDPPPATPQNPIVPYDGYASRQP